MNLTAEKRGELIALLEELAAILELIKAEAPVPVAEDASLDAKAFFDYVRSSLFNGRLTSKQVSGMEAKIAAFRAAGFRLSWAAYALATSYHETAKKMQPVREGLNASEAWRKRNLRYYPWYGRGDVQLTWEENYVRADKKLGLNGRLVADLDLALDPEISAKIMVQGMQAGWFAGDKSGRHTLQRHLPNNVGTALQFKSARRIINGTDKAQQIAGYALEFQEALRLMGWEE